MFIALSDNTLFAINSSIFAGGASVGAACETSIIGLDGCKSGLDIQFFTSRTGGASTLVVRVVFTTFSVNIMTVLICSSVWLNILQSHIPWEKYPSILAYFGDKSIYLISSKWFCVNSCHVSIGHYRAHCFKCFAGIY